MIWKTVIYLPGEDSQHDCWDAERIRITKPPQCSRGRQKAKKKLRQAFGFWLKLQT
jgi:hypothetical protein